MAETTGRPLPATGIYRESGRPDSNWRPSPTFCASGSRPKIAQVAEHLGFARSDLEQFNGNLEGAIRAAVTRRREQLLADERRLAAFDLPVDRPAKPPQTYAAPRPPRQGSRWMPSNLFESVEPMKPMAEAISEARAELLEAGASGIDVIGLPWLSGRGSPRHSR